MVADDPMSVHVCAIHGSPPAHWLLPGLHNAVEAIWFEHVEGSRHWPVGVPLLVTETQQTCVFEQVCWQRTATTRGQLASGAHWPPSLPASARVYGSLLRSVTRKQPVERDEAAESSMTAPDARNAIPLKTCSGGPARAPTTPATR